MGALLLALQPALASAHGCWQRLDRFLAGQTGEGAYLGALAVVEQDGRQLYRAGFGHADLARQRPLREDAIFRIYSMTKPVTSVAVLMLVEDGKLDLDDPVSRLLPEFAGQQQVHADGPAGTRLGAPERALTLRHLLTHTSGFAYDHQRHPHATQRLAEADLDNAASLQELARRLARVPLAEAPGTHFHYEGANTDLLARIVEVASGQSFASFLQQRIFGPLGMVDTGLEVPPAQRHRVVDLPTSDEGGKLRLADTGSAREPGTRLKRYDNGAGGLYSTLDDYLKFARMLLNDGRSGERRLLSRRTVDLMMSDQLASAFGAPVAGESAGEGFGLGGYVVTDPQARGRLGSVGQFGWSGAASTYFTVDRRERLLVVLLAQYLPHGPQRLPALSTPFYNLVYQAIR